MLFVHSVVLAFSEHTCAFANEVVLVVQEEKPTVNLIWAWN